MKAKKSSPKSIRFNIKHFEEGMSKGSFESAQEMVDFLIKNYVEGENVKLNVSKTKETIVHKSVQNDTIKSKVDKELNSWERLRNKKLGIKQ